MNRPPPVLVACCGNPLAGDDAFGPAVARALLEHPDENLQVLDLAMRPASLVEHLEGRRMLLIVDAAEVPGRPPGQVIELPWDEEARKALASPAPASTHGLSIADQLALAHSLGMTPPTVRLVLLTIAAAAVGGRRHEAFERCVQQAAARIRRLALPV